MGRGRKSRQGGAFEERKAWKGVAGLLIAAALIAGGISGSRAQSNPVTGPPVTWTGSDATPAFRALKGIPVTPAAAYSQLGGTTTSTDGLCRDYASNAAICPSGSRPRHPEIKELARALRNDPDLIYEFVRNTVDTEFQFGLAKGELGAVIDRSATSFDQAKLLVELLREAGYSASYKYGDISLTGPEFEAWTGFSNAKAACEFMAGGGIPATINGVTGTCSQTGNVTSAVIAHVWVQVTIGGQAVLMDPSYKAYEHLSGVDVKTLSGFSAGASLTAATSGVTRTDGGATTQGYAASALHTQLESNSDTLRGWLKQQANRGLSIEEVVGGRRIVWAERPSGGWRQTALGHVTTTRATWSNVPNTFRATLGIAFQSHSLLTADFYLDEIYGRPIVLNPSAIVLDTVTIEAPAGPCSPCSTGQNLTLQLNRPFPASSGTYGDAVVARPVSSLDGAVVLVGIGATSRSLGEKWSREYGPDTIPAGSIYDPQGNNGRMMRSTSWLSEFSQARVIQEALAKGRANHLHSLGVLYTLAHQMSFPQVRSDVTEVIDVETAVATTIFDGGTSARRALIHSLAATAATLEGNITDAPDTISTARRWDYANDQGGTHKFYGIAANGTVPSASKFTQGVMWIDHVTTLRTALSAYVSQGFAVTTASDAYLGPGSEFGSWYDSQDGGLSLAPSNQRGGAFVATKYDGAGDPSEIAHVVTNFYIAAKGGGAASVPDKMLSPTQMLADGFVDRSSVYGIDLRSGAVGYSTPVLSSAGQGEFPYKLEETLQVRAGRVDRALSPTPSNGPRETDPGLVSNFRGTAQLASSAYDAMGGSVAEAAAQTIVAFLAMQDVYSSAPTSDRAIVGLLVADWWGQRLVHNVVLVTQGASSETFLDAGMDGTRRVFTSATGAGKVYVSNDVEIQYPTAFPYSHSSIAQYMYSEVRFEYVSSSGETKQYLPGTDAAAFGPTHRLSSWEFPTGVELTFSYAFVTGGALTPQSVTSNVGVSLVLSTLPRQVMGSIAPNKHTSLWPCAPESNARTEYYSIVDAGARTHKLHFRQPVARTVSTRPQAHCYLDAVYEPLSMTTPAVQYTYDSTGAIKEARDKIAIVTPGVRGPHQFFIAGGFRSSRLDPAGGEFAVGVRDGGRKVLWIDEMNRVSTVTYDGRSRIVSRVSPWGDTLRFSYDGRDNLIERRHEPRSDCAVGKDAWQQSWLCQTIVITADYHTTWNKPVSVTLPATTAGDPTTKTWILAYNAQGLVSSVTGPTVWDARNGANAQPVWSSWYDNRGRVIRTRDPTGIEVTQVWGGGGLPDFCLRQSRVAAQSGSSLTDLTTQYGCDPVGNITSVTDPRGHTTTATYDALRRKTMETGPAGTDIISSWVYNANGDVTHEGRWDSVAATFRTTTTTWSPTRKPLTVTDPLGHVTRTCYDALDRPVAVVDGENRAVQTDYNAAGQPVAVKRWRTAAPGSCTLSVAADAPTETRWRRMAYNEGGLQLSETDARNNVTALDYDGLGRPYRTIYPDASEAWVLTDERGQVRFKRQRAGDWAVIYYDAAGRDYHVTEYDNGAVGFEGRHVRAGLDLAGRPVWRDVSTQVSQTAFDDTLLRDVRTYAYDDAGRLTHDQVKPEGYGAGPTQLLQYGYDKAGNRTSISWPGGWTASYVYDAANRPESVSFPGPGGTRTVGLDHDSLGQLTLVDRPGSAADTAFSYYADGGLQSLGHDFVPSGGIGPLDLTYGQDASHKLTSVGISVPAFEWIPPVNYGRTYGAANALNQVTSEGGVSVTWNGNGNMTSDGVNTYGWTWGNRLATATRAGMTASYDYDSDDRRTKKIVNGVMTRTLWSGVDEVAEADASGALLRYIVPDGSGRMDGRLAVVEASTGLVTWLHTDHQGSVVATSNDAGQVVSTATYSPHGEIGSATGLPPAGSPFGYTGRQYDAETGLYQYRARYYSPRLGVFLSTDPIGTKDDPNLYLYVNADPVNHTDPTGMIGCKEGDPDCTITRTPNSDGSVTVSRSETVRTEERGVVRTTTVQQGSIRLMPQNQSARGAPAVVTPEMQHRLLEFSEKEGKTVNVTSGIRTPEQNRIVGGATNSAHLTTNSDQAADISITGYTRAETAAAAYRSGEFERVNDYGNSRGVHVDLHDVGPGTQFYYNWSRRSGP